MPVNGAMIILPSSDGNMYGSHPDGDFPVGPGNPIYYMQTFAGIANGTPADTDLFDFQWGSWEIQGEKLIGTGTTPAPSAYSWLIGRDTGASNGGISLTFNAQAGSGDEAAILFRCVDEFNFLDCINLNGTIRVFSIIDSGVSILDAGGYAIPGYDNTADYQLEVYAWGDQINVYLDGTLIHDITSSTFINGTIWGIKSSNGIYQTYDNIMLPDFYVDQETSATVYFSRHSMVDHIFDDPETAPTTTYTQCENWMPLIATNSSVTLSIPDTRFGNVEGINDIWAAETPDPWPDSWDTESYTHYLAMAPNFVQNYENDLISTGAPSAWAAHFDEYAGRVLSTGQNPEMLIIEAVGYARFLIGDLPVDDTNLTSDEFLRWRQHMRTTSTDWYVDFLAELVALRPNAKFRIVPFCQIFCDLVETGYLSGTVWTDFFGGDAAPHGTPTYYLLTSIVMHRAIYGTNPDFTGFTWPEGHGVISEVTSNIDTIVTYIGNRMDHYESDADSPYRYMVY